MLNKLKIMLLVVFTAGSAFGQDITGQWNGLLKVQGIQLRVVFHITKTADGYTSTMDSPDQGAAGIPVTSTTFENPKLKLEVANLQIEYNGELKENVVTGTFRQGMQSFSMDLKREAIEKEVIVRPQEPKKPYPYYSEEVTFQNTKAGITLAGTLTLPEKDGKFPVVVMITGSGPQNRDEELLGHKPFLVISDYLTRNGIAVLRYDDRGTAQSTGDFKGATSDDFVTDVEAAVVYLKSRKEVDQKKIGLIGHSEGGLIAPIVASKSKDIRFIVLLAGPGIQGSQILLMQQELIARAGGVAESEIETTKKINTGAFDLVIKTENTEKLKAELTAFLKQALKDNPGVVKTQGMSEDDFIKVQVDQTTSPWMLNFIRFNPQKTLEKVKCPVLALNGEKDLQVPPKENLAAIKTALQKGGNKKGTVKMLPGLNHLFQECKTGSPAEYATIEQTFSPVALDEITKWILLQVK